MAKLTWMKRWNGIQPGPSKYPVPLLKKNPVHIKMLIHYYEAVCDINKVFIEYQQPKMEDYW